jgi:hypothetical protein
MYMSDGVSPLPVTPPAASSVFALLAPAVLIFYVGILPTRLLDLAIRSIATIL